MGRNKKESKIKKMIILFFLLNIYLFINILLLITSYDAFNIESFNYLNYYIIPLVMQPFIIVFSIYYGKNNKKFKKIHNKFKGLLIAITTIIFMITICSLVYRNIKQKQIRDENERKYDLYSYYINFDSYEIGYNYRIDESTGNLYYMDEKTSDIIEIKPTTFSKMHNDYKFDVYKVEKGYAILNNNTMYFTKELTVNSRVYEIKYPFSKIKKKCKMEEYYKLEGNDFTTISPLYSSEQNGKLLMLYKKFNNIFYTKEKIYDLRIQMQNNFGNTANIKYNKRYILLNVNNKNYKIKYTFNSLLNVIYSKEEV